MITNRDLRVYRKCDFCGTKVKHLHHFLRVKTCCKCRNKGSNYKGSRMKRDFHEHDAA